MDVLKPEIIDIDGRQYRKQATFSSFGNSDRTASSLPCDAEDEFPGIFVGLTMCVCEAVAHALTALTLVNGWYAHVRVDIGKLACQPHSLTYIDHLDHSSRREEARGSNDFCFYCIQTIVRGRPCR